MLFSYISVSDIPSSQNAAAYYLFKETDTWRHMVSRIQSDEEEERKKDEYILCGACQFKITSKSAIIEVNGRHNHTFSNPAGIIFDIGCFRSAEGCLVHGDPTTDFTWFPGYSWNFALCANCFVHLGWYFQSTTSHSFFGLITQKLIEG
ncbi:MAG: cereblon family protein [bacterium]